MGSMSVVQTVVHPHDLFNCKVMQRTRNTYGTPGNAAIWGKENSDSAVVNMDTSLIEHVLYDKIDGLLEWQFQTV